MKKRMLSSALALGLSAAMLAGCGSGSSSESDASAVTGGSTAVASASGEQVSSADAASIAAGVQDADGNWSKQYSGTKITFMDVAPGDARTSYFENLFQEFQKDTGIEVEYQSVPWDDAADKMTVLGSSGKLPDVMTVWSGWLGQYTAAGWVEPLTDYIGDSTDEYSDAVTKILWESEKTRYGNIYTIPDGLMVKGIYVRKDWCDELGIKLDPTKSWTYDDYFDLCKKLTDKEKGRYGAAFRGARGALDPLWVYMQGYTGGATYDSDGKILMNSDECLTAFEKWCDIYLKGYAPEDSINWGFTEMVDNFVGGLAGTLINDSEVAATLIKLMDDSQWMVMPMPTSDKDGKIYNTMNAPYSYAMSANSKNKGAAYELMMYMTSADKQAEYCETTGEIPIKKDAANIDMYSSDGYYGTFIQEMNDPTLSVPATYGAFDYTDLHQGLFHEEIQSYLLGDEDAKTALDNICNALQEREDEYKEENPDAVVETALSMQ